MGPPKYRWPAGDQAHGAVARPLEARNEQKWGQQKKPARFVRIAELEGLTRKSLAGNKAEIGDRPDSLLQIPH